MVIVADSAIQLSLEYLASIGVEVVDYPTFMNGVPYREATMRMTEEEKEKMRSLLKDKNNNFTTAGLRAEDLTAAYRKFPGQKIISLHQSSKATTVTADTIRKVLSENKDLDVTYVDSTFLTSAYSAIVKEAAIAAGKGMSFNEVMKVIDTCRRNARHLGVIYDLFYLHHTGRIGLAKAVLGTAMKIINILSSAEEPGNLKSIGKVKNFRQANERFLSVVKEDLASKGGKSVTGVISVVGPHSPEAEHLAELVRGLGIGADVRICGTNHSNMPHVGPDFYDFGYIITH
jgi:DegV family protein with EDD domain